METVVKSVRSGRGRRGRWPTEQKLAALQEWRTGRPLEEVCRRFGMNAALLHRFKRNVDQGLKDTARFSCLAAAIDLAGYFSIKRSVHCLGQGGPDEYAYEERVAFKQVNPLLPRLFKETFGGTIVTEKPSKPHLSPAYRWEATDLRAAQIAQVLLPYLRLTREQAQGLLEMRRWKERPEAQSYVWWWLRKHPDWQGTTMLTASEVAKRLGYKNSRSVNEALSDGLLVAVPAGSQPQRRFPASLIAYLAKNWRRPDGTSRVNPPQLMAVYERLHRRVQKLNQQTKRPSTRRMRGLRDRDG